MEIILLENIINLGNIGDRVKVKNGYGRNFLLKQGKALRYNKENKELVNKKKDELNKKNIEIKNKFKEISKLVNNKTFTFYKESKENGEIYGTIKPNNTLFNFYFCCKYVTIFASNFTIRSCFLFFLVILV